MSHEKSVIMESGERACRMRRVSLWREEKEYIAREDCHYGEWRKSMSHEKSVIMESGERSMSHEKTVIMESGERACRMRRLSLWRVEKEHVA